MDHLRRYPQTTCSPPGEGLNGYAQTQGYQLAFGSQSNSQSALIQVVELEAGQYRFSWFTKEGAPPTFVGGAAAGVVRGTGITTVKDDVWEASSTPGWNRRAIVFRVANAGAVRVGFGLPSSGSVVTVAAPMLEVLPDAAATYALSPFTGTRETLTRELPVCEDSDGAVFRTRWRRECQKLCADGYSSQCSDGRAKTFCFREAEFGISQRGIQHGKIFKQGGFARGNFNYRIESLALNFVGANVRDCSDSVLPATCFSAGYVPYSLYHKGPFFVRNHLGDDYRAFLFDGAIEHARGLGTERYVTNPLSTADSELLAGYQRLEFQGRPLDGNFAVRVWEEPGVNFDAIEDVQVVLNYRYWTRFD
jgi:hypothetical protein